MRIEIVVEKCAHQNLKANSNLFQIATILPFIVNNEFAVEALFSLKSDKSSKPRKGAVSGSVAPQKVSGYSRRLITKSL